MPTVTDPTLAGRIRLGCSPHPAPPRNRSPHDETRSGDRIYSLFTMSNNRPDPKVRPCACPDKPGGEFLCNADVPGVSHQISPNLVEPDGIEPTTSCLQSTRSPN